MNSDTASDNQRQSAVAKQVEQEEVGLKIAKASLAFASLAFVDLRSEKPEVSDA